MKKERWFNMDKLSPFFLSSLVITSIIIFFILYSPNPFDDVVSKHDPDHQRNVSFQFQKDDENCDLFKGHWVPDMNGSLYTNWSCSTIPDSKNCMKNGRKDGDFVNWRWKPEDCELPRFDPNAFLQIVKGKKMAFIGDSVARNHMESLLCLLSTVSSSFLFLDRQFFLFLITASQDFPRK
ncbi:xyloglucan O-acetyltransferase 2 [Sarracenia purpurea var. burkii]